MIERTGIGRCAVGLGLAVMVGAGAVNAQAPDAAAQIEALNRRVEDLETQQREWISPDSTLHVAGYAAVDYVVPEQGDPAFQGVNFNPIFHYQYKDILLFESELEVGIDEDGETETELEYASIDVLLNDYLTLMAGKFQSPVGNFRQNLHPAWVNKLPTAPPGFGHDGAAPTAEVGLQARGGWPLASGTRLTYSAYVGNGPVLELASHDEGGETALPGDETAEEEPEIEALASEGFAADEDGNPAFGGRISILPRPNLELGVSAAGGKVALEDEADRNHSIVGADFWWQVRSVELRGEYVRAKVDALESSVAPDGQEWESLYLQAAWAVVPDLLELVLRYTDFDSTHEDLVQTQWAAGVDYLFARNVVWKLAYEFNDGEVPDSAADTDRFITQIAYGF